jgi:asparagine synthase (glutamine-hydrolysing)
MSHFFGCLAYSKEVDLLSIQETMNQYFNYLDSKYESIYKDQNIFIHNKLNTQSKYNFNQNECYQTESYVIVGGFRIDNRKELIQHTKLSENTTNVELIIALYKKERLKFIEKIKGDYSFIIWDKKRKTLMLCKDRIGIKPLFYYKSKKAFFFSTNLRAIIPFVNQQNSLNKKYIAKSLKNYAANVEETFFKDITRLKPAHFLITDLTKKHKLNCYWKLKKINISQFDSIDKIKIEFLRLFNLAVSNRIEPYKIIGGQLSGGLDSSSILSLTSKAIKNINNLHTYSFVLNEKTKPFSSTGIDEQPTQQIMLENIKIPKENHHQITEFHFKNVEEEYQTVQKIMGAYAETDSIWQDSLFRKAMENKVELILSGFGGDELISSTGNLYYYDLIAQGKWGKLYNNVQSKIYVYIYNYILSFLKGTYQWNYKKLQQKRNLLNKSSIFQKTLKDKSFKFYFNYKRIQKSNILQAHVALRTESENAYASQYNMEVAYPLLDIDLITFTYSIPAEYFKPEKLKRMFFRKMCKEILPEKILYQSKNNGANTLAFSEYNKKKKIEELKNIPIKDKLKMFNLKIENDLDEIDNINLKLTLYELDYFINLFEK